MSYAKCCTPIPGDPIVGYLSAGKGMVVHMESCRNIVDIRHNPENASSSTGPRTSPANSTSNCASSWNTSAA